jgi:hypothetical protein
MGGTFFITKDGKMVYSLLFSDNSQSESKNPKSILTIQKPKSRIKNIFEASGYNIVMVQKALGHKNLSATHSYLGVDEEELKELIL